MLWVLISLSFVLQGSLCSNSQELEGGEVELQWSNVILAPLTRYHIPQFSGFECVYLKVRVLLESPQLILLGELKIHDEIVLSGVAQDFMSSMRTMGLS